MQTYVVTGGGGFLGAEAVRALAERGDRVVVLDVVESPALLALRAIHPNISVVVGEVTEWPLVAHLLKEHQPRAVVHCAAVVGVPHSLAWPIRTMEVNVGGTLNVLEAMRLTGVQRMVHISSEETYGPFHSDSINEDHPQVPLHPYGTSKLAVEHLGRSYQDRYGLESIHLRTCWVYGPGLPRPRIPKNLVDAAINGESLHLPSGGDFVTDHTHVLDSVQGILLALDKEAHPFDAYNIGSGVGHSLTQIVEIIKELIPEADISVGPGNYLFNGEIPAVKKGALDITRAREVLGYNPRFDIRTGFRDYIESRREGLA